MHILQGTSAASVFKEAFNIGEEEILICNDTLSCGALKKYTDMKSWKVFREESWKTLDPYTFKNISEDDTLERDFYTNFNDFKLADTYKVWIGTGLGDQLFLAFIVHLIDYYGLDMQKLLVYQFDKIERKHFSIEAWGVALLNAEEIRSHPVPYALTGKQIAVAKSAWEAVTAPTPEKYLKHLHGDTDNLSLLTKAMGFLFLRYPDKNTGLSYWDKVLLEYTQKREPQCARIIGDVLGYEFNTKYNLDIVGDAYFFSRLKNLGKPSLNKPLVKVNAFNVPMRETEVNILPTALKVLSGELNMIQENGIDDWVCGVHLDSSSGGAWVRDSKNLVWHTY